MMVKIGMLSNNFPERIDGIMEYTFRRKYSAISVKYCNDKNEGNSNMRGRVMKL